MSLNHRINTTKDTAIEREGETETEGEEERERKGESQSEGEMERERDKERIRKHENQYQPTGKAQDLCFDHVIVGVSDALNMYDRGRESERTRCFVDFLFDGLGMFERRGKDEVATHVGEEKEKERATVVSTSSFDGCSASSRDLYWSQFGPHEPHMLLIERGNRHLINREALCRIGRELGFRVSVVRFEKLTKREQMTVMRDVSVLVGVLGTGFMNTLWMAPGTAVRKCIYCTSCFVLSFLFCSLLHTYLNPCSFTRSLICSITHTQMWFDTHTLPSLHPSCLTHLFMEGLSHRPIRNWS